jgi:phosphatidylglycerol:prolipoprotein diacylglycerol transferase
LKRIEPYWVIVIAFIAVSAGLLIWHWTTGTTPSRVAFSLFGLDVYWYGIWIISGIAAGAYTVSRLALERATRAYESAVPIELRERPLTETSLPEDLIAALAAQKMTTLGDVLWAIGLDPARSGLKKPDQARLLEALAAESGVDAQWPADSPWRQWNPDHVWNALVLILILGVIGARLYHVLTPSPSMQAVGIYTALDYFRNPYQLINIRNGGLGIFGATLGGLLGLLIYTRRNRISMLGWADLAVVGMALGHAIGRWGNFFNQELYGRPTGAPWAITIDPAHRLPDFAQFTSFHPTFLYESIWNLLTFFLLIWLVRRRYQKMLPGEVLAVYLVAYAVGRSLLELIRLDSRTVNLLGLQTNLAVATLVSIAMAVVAVALVLYRRRRLGRAAGPPPPVEDASGQVSAG